MFTPSPSPPKTTSPQFILIFRISANKNEEKSAVSLTDNIIYLELFVSEKLFTNLNQLETQLMWTKNLLAPSGALIAIPTY